MVVWLEKGTIDGALINSLQNIMSPPPNKPLPFGFAAGWRTGPADRSGVLYVGPQPVTAQNPSPKQFLPPATLKRLGLEPVLFTTESEARLAIKQLDSAGTSPAHSPSIEQRHGQVALYASESDEHCLVNRLVRFIIRDDRQSRWQQSNKAKEEQLPKD
jgi:hypothetical protein